MDRFFVFRVSALLFLTFGSNLVFAAKTNLVQIGDFFFSPQVITITNGDTVLWSNTSLTLPHDSTSSNSVWTTGSFFRPNARSFTFTSTGSFPYHCQTHAATHPEQNGTVTVLAGANAAPTVMITNPVNNATFTAPATFTVQAKASDTDGSVTQIEFFRGTTSLGIDNASPYSADANNLAAGTYTISAVATDSGGAKSTNSITVVVKNPPMPVTLANPNMTGDTFTFSFLSETGRTYTVYFETELNPALWQPLTNFVANSTNTVITNLTSDGQGFYRVGAQ